jgi:hypothetical protein
VRGFDTDQGLSATSLPFSAKHRLGSLIELAALTAVHHAARNAKHRRARDWQRRE